MGTHILHIDDDEAFLDLVSTFVKNQIGDVDVATKTSAEDGLEYLSGHDVDCIVSDYQMPETDGIEFLKQVRQKDSEIPFILFTGKGSEEIASKAISNGVTDYLQKRIGTSQYEVLVNRIENYVDKYRKEKELERSEEYRLKLYKVTSSTDLSSKEKIKRLLKLGSERLGVENGYLTFINREKDLYEIVEVNGSHIENQKGEKFDLSETYCRKTIESDEILGFRNLPEQGWDGDPAQEKFDFGCYLGSKIIVDEELFGTVCFADISPRDSDFIHTEKAFVDTLGRWLSYELQRTGGVEGD